MVAFTIRGPIERDDLPGLYARVCALLRSGAGQEVVIDVRGVEPDAVTVEAVARLQLAARRHGCRLRMSGASPALLGLIAFLGLSGALNPA